MGTMNEELKRLSVATTLTMDDDKFMFDLLKKANVLVWAVAFGQVEIVGVKTKSIQKTAKDILNMINGDESSVMDFPQKW